MGTRIIVCGGKDFTNQTYCFATLDSILPNYEQPEIISGHAKGADTFGEEYAKLHGLKLTVFPAEWKRYGKAVGPIRNKQMLLYALEENPVVIAFWNGTSRGTKNMITQARKANVEFHIVDI